MLSLIFHVFHLKGRGDLHAVTDGAGNWTVVHMETKHSFGHIALGRVDLQVITYVDAPDNQNLFVQLNLACRL